MLQKRDACLAACFFRFRIPYACLHFADVRASEKKHAQAALSDTAADRERKLAREKRFVERKRTPVIAAGFGQLPV